MSLEEQNLQNLCHFCLKKGKRLKSIFEKSFQVSKKVENDDLCFLDFLSLVFTNTKIQEENAFPKYVCNWCIRQVDNFMTFRLNCFKSFKHLHSIQAGVNCIEPIESIKSEESPLENSNENEESAAKKKHTNEEENPVSWSARKKNLPTSSTDFDIANLAEVEIKAETDDVNEDEFMQATSDLEDSLPDVSESNFNELNESESKDSNDDECWEPEITPTKTRKQSTRQVNKSPRRKKSRTSESESDDDEEDSKKKKKNSKKKPPEKSEATICTICGGSFKSMKQHIKVHSNERPFPCDLCESRFKDKGTLDYHISAVHLNLRPHKCDQCGKGYNNKKGLRFHMLTHSDERNFKCEICGLTFKWVTALRKHKATHQQNRRFECTECGKTFLTKYQLTQHSWIHTGEKPHPCKICDKRFRTAGERRVHELSVHRDVFKQETKRFRITMNTVATQQNE